jgi:hypothetical protein
VTTMVTSLTKYLLFVALFICSSAFAASNTLVTITKPYDNGAVDLKADASNDTITFSNGVKLLNYYPINGIPETHLSTGAIVILDTIHTKAGYKYSSSIKTDSVSNGFAQFHKTVYFLGGNPDTVWNNAVRFPDSFHVLDSTIVQGNSQRNSCKYIFVNGPTDKPVSVNSPLPNYGAIIYLTSHNGQNMKLQVYDLAYDTVKLSAAVWYLSLSSYKLRWAVDSLGNGKFEISTGASGNRMNNARSYNKSDIASLHFWSKNKRIQGGYLLNGRIVKAIDARVVPYITKN